MLASPAPDGDIARARRAVSVMFVANGVAFASWAARVPAVRERLALRDSALGLALLGVAVGAMLAFRAAGPLIARFGSRRVTRVSAVLLCAALPLPALAPSFAALVAALLLLGASNGLMDVAMNAQAVEVERRHRGPILASFHGMFSLGGLIGASLGALAADRALSPAAHLFAVAAVLAVAVTAAGGALSADARPEAPAAAAAGAPAERRSTRLLLLGLIAFCSSIGEGAMANWSAVYLRDELHTTAAVAATGYAVFSLAMLLGRFSGDGLTQRFGPERLVRAAALVVAAGLGAALLVNVPIALLVGFGCVGAGLSVVVPLVFRAGASAPGVAPGRALSTLATLSYGGFLVGPPAIGLLADLLTLRGGLVLVVALVLVIVALAPAVARGSAAGAPAACPPAACPPALRAH
ncbi:MULTISPECIES: MFS transporter [Sorangium]|uniref:MFS transporter n=1 Tax=Sorangium cellulosum TaxID=56 RepID=A0A4P2QRQ1_SORCE|nr:MULTISPECIES: MFS transporter [Sorangium]AUX32914.1 MFS transporter [Sorangium cellulosum]WCQ92290.1 Inner membrane protein YbjJ [Sorangium sp. Soce836]